MTRRSDLAFAVILALCLAAFPAGSQEPSADQGARPSFSEWLADLRAEALEAGIRAETLDAALTGIEPLTRVVELDRKQPEVTQTFSEYMARRVTPALVAEGIQKLRENRALLEAVSRRYGVQPRFIVALWGVETRYGKYGGSFSVIASLATLAYDARRSAYFRRELIDALRILDEGHIAPTDMKGSWAGAMGQNQFMPSSFMRFAVDQNGDGRRDIWTTPADIFASSANYLARSGWRGDQTWGREVRLPESFTAALAGHAVKKRLSEWQELGVRRADGSDLPTRDLLASVIMPGGADGPAFVVYDNYRTILKWNHSDYFGMSVGRLADLIGSG
ncbi:MAG: lytic transglycosylase domain-containing protein [Alphaproteobacteria bacterium]